MRLIGAIGLLMLAAQTSGLFFGCNWDNTDSFIMTAEAKNIMSAMSSQRLKAWAYTWGTDYKCIEVELNFNDNTYKFFQTDSETNVQSSTSGTIAVTRSRTDSEILFTQTTSGTDTEVFGIEKDSPRTWRFSYLNPTDIMLNYCSEGLFYVAYDTSFLSTADLSGVSSTCFKNVLSTEMDFSNVERLNLTQCAAYTTTITGDD